MESRFRAAFEIGRWRSCLSDGSPVAFLRDPLCKRAQLEPASPEMTDGDNKPRQSPSGIDGEPRPLPIGYRQGLITAITVLLGFSLTFLRFWGFEAPGQWTLQSVTSTGISILAVLLQLVALYRSLRLEDDDEREYRKTVIWFIASAVALLLGFLLALVESSLA